MSKLPQEQYNRSPAKIGTGPAGNRGSAEAMASAEEASPQGRERQARWYATAANQLEGMVEIISSASN